MRGHGPGDAVPGVVLTGQLRSAGRCGRTVDEQPQRPHPHRRAVRRHHVSSHLTAGHHHRLRGARGRRGQLRRRHGGPGWRPDGGRRPPGVVGQGGRLLRRGTLDRRHRTGQGCRAVVGQVPGGRRRRGPRGRRGQPRPLHRSRTQADRVQFVSRGRGVRRCDRVVSRDDPPQPGQRGVGDRAARVVAGHPPGTQSCARTAGSNPSIGHYDAGADRVPHRSVGPVERVRGQLRP